MKRLSTRFLVYYAIVYLVLIGLMGVIVERTVRATLLDDVEDNLVVAATLAREGLPADPGEYQSWAERTFQVSGYRTTLIRTDGVVLADSHLDPGTMENHGTRPEVLAALDGEVGTAQRVSASNGTEQVYVALPPVDDLIVRMSLSTRAIADHLGVVRRAILLSALGIGLLAVALVAFLGRRMAQPISELTRQARSLLDEEADVAPRRSSVSELDELGLAISELADRWAARVAEAEEAVETLEVVLGALPQGTILIDKDDRVVYANPSAQAILGLVPAQLSGLAPLQFQNAVRLAREKREQEARIVDHGSPTRRLRGVATPFSADERVLLLVVDVTERERTDSIRRDFVANASHELKTPVATIIASSEAMQIALERRDESAAGFARRIEDSARQLDRLVGDLLDLSRLEGESPTMAEVRLELLVREEVERIRPVAGERGLTLDIAVEPVLVRGSNRDIAIAVRNILENAVRYSTEGGSISVTVGRDDDRAIVSVSDTGVGIPTRDMARVFERFYRVDSARSRATGGTGLGLSIAKHVAESHGGQVSVESELGVGSTFTIRLPLEDGITVPADN